MNEPMLEPTVKEAVKVFRELGWVDQPLSAAPILDCGDENQRELVVKALEATPIERHPGGVQAGKSVYPIDVAMFSLFAIRMGVSARCAVALPLSSNWAIVAGCIAERGPKFAEDFLEHLPQFDPTDSSWFHTGHLSHSVPVWLHVVHTELGLPIPRDHVFLQHWAIAAARIFVGKLPEGIETFYGEVDELPTQKDFLASATHFVGPAVEAGVPVNGALGLLFPVLVAEGKLSRPVAIGWVVAAAVSAVRPKERKFCIDLLLNQLGATDEELAAHCVALSMLVTADSHAVSTVGIRLLRAVDASSLVDVAIGALSATTKTAQRAVLEVLGSRTDLPDSCVAALLPQVSELARSQDLRVKSRANKVLRLWGCDLSIDNTPAKTPSTRKTIEIDTDTYEEPMSDEEFAQVWQPPKLKMKQLKPVLDGMRIELRLEDTFGVEDIAVVMTLPDQSATLLKPASGYPAPHTPLAWQCQVLDAPLTAGGTRVQMYPKWRAGEWVLEKSTVPMDESVLPVTILSLAFAQLCTKESFEFVSRPLQTYLDMTLVSPKAVVASMKQLLACEFFNPGRAARFIAENPTCIATLWPVVTESLAWAAQQPTLPRWVNDVLKVALAQVKVLSAATRRGEIPPQQWEPLGVLAAHSGKSVALSHARELHSKLSIK
ncbi:MAG: hypothetical protein Q4D85_06595 [Corynebacterium sp.]|uniref:hypothetical protein n=1 Tax=Corynebacterium sp. TaxID=1720 RepID=UPI0026DB3028|nr:hypothetical protein [Corynebacterium sp.]MDO5098413.1 hypothetical protein [Corynebacterium sp.]